MNGSTGPDDSVHSNTHPLQNQRAYNHSWPPFDHATTSPVPFLQPDSTLRPFQTSTASGPFSFSPTYLLLFYNLIATNFSFPPCMSDPRPGPSSGRATYNPFHFSSSASDTYVLTATVNKGKATAIVSSPSHTVSGISVLHIPTSTYGNRVATPLPLFLSSLSSPRIVLPNTPSSFPSYHPLSLSVSAHSPPLSQSPFAPRLPSYASPLSMHTSAHPVAHPTPIYAPPATPHFTPVPVPNTPHFLPAHPTPLRTPFVLMPPSPAPLPLLGAVAPV